MSTYYAQAARDGVQKGSTLDISFANQFGGRNQAWLKKAWLTSLNTAEKTAYEELKRHYTTSTSYMSDSKHASSQAATFELTDKFPVYSRDGHFRSITQKTQRREFARDMIVKQADYNNGLAKSGAGVTTGLGFNFIDLRAPALFLAPVEVPFRNSLARVGRQNDGWGVAPIWRASRNLGQNYGGASEGNRVATRTPDQITYTVPYKQMGGESAVTTSAEWASEGYSPQLADEHVRGLLSFFLSEEAMDLHGNAGTAGAGYALGTPAAPTGVQNTVTSTGFTGTTHVSVCCVYATAMGAPVNNQYGYLTNLAPLNSVANGLLNSVVRTNADLSQDVISGGISGVSPMSATVTCDATHTATFTAWSEPTGTSGTVGAPKGVFQYFWYVDIIDASVGSRANAVLSYQTQFPTLTITSPAQAGTQVASALLVGANPQDNSYNALDYTGLIGYAASTPGAYWADLQGGTITPLKDGKILEIENMLEYIYTQFQSRVSAFWVSADMANNIDAAVRYGGNGGQPSILWFQRDQANNLLGGFVVSAYQSRYAAANPVGANQIPIMIHPMMPAGTLFADINEIPTGYESSRLPYMRAILTRQDYHSYEWPMVSRTWTFGTYVEQMLQHLMPWSSAVITGCSGVGTP